MALTKTTSIDVIDNWQAVGAGLVVVGAAKSLADSYDTLLFVELAIIEAVAHGGCDVLVEISYGNDNWVALPGGHVLGTDETPATTTINDAAVTGGDTDITLTDSATGDFNVLGRKWFIKDGTIANSESVRTKSDAAHTVTLCHDLLRSHANGLNVYDRVNEWTFPIPMPAAYVRTIIINTDADCDVAFTTRVSKVTVMS